MHLLTELKAVATHGCPYIKCPIQSSANIAAQIKCQKDERFLRSVCFQIETPSGAGSAEGASIDPHFVVEGVIPGRFLEAELT
jgi:hypothetical protein